MSDVDVARDLSLTAFLERELGVQAKRTGRSLRFNYCPECRDDGHQPNKLMVQQDDRYYLCYRCRDKGSIIDAAMKLWGLDFKEALKKLVAGQSHAIKRVPIDPEKIKKEDSARNEKIAEVLKRLQPVMAEFSDDFRCIQYLTKDRNLPLEIIREAQKRGIIGFLPSNVKRAEEKVIAAAGEQLLREAGMWKEGAKRPSICYRPIVFMLPGHRSAEFRIIGQPKKDMLKSIRFGTQLKFPFVWRAKEGMKAAAVVEGCIDMLSMVALGYQGHVIGLPGCNNWNRDWFPALRNSLGIEGFTLALDNDSESSANPGQSALLVLKEALDEMGIPNSKKELPPNSDINEILKSKKAA